MRRVNRETRRTVAEALRSRARPDGSIRHVDVIHIATQLEVSTRTVWRWLEDTRGTTERERFMLDDTSLAVIAAHRRGNTVILKAAWRDLVEAGADISYDTLRRAWRSEDTALTGMIAGGAAGHAANSMYLEISTERRNQMWFVDHQEIPVWVTEGFKPWQTTFIDHATRLVVHTAVTRGRVGTEDVVSMFIDAVVGHTARDGIFVGGVPELVVWDQGAEFLSPWLSEVVIACGSRGEPANAYSPWEKGVLERWHRTSQDELFARLPGYSKGPRTFTVKDPFRDQNERLTFDELTAQTALWVGQYNASRPHSSLGDRTPLEAWDEDPAVLQHPPDAGVRLGMKRYEGTRVVAKNGVMFNKVRYQSAALQGHRGRKVTFRYLPSDPSTIEIYHEDGETWICTAKPHADMTEKERTSLLAARRDTYFTGRAITYDAVRRIGSEALEAAHDGTHLPGNLTLVAPVTDDTGRDDLLELLAGNQEAS